MPKRPSPDPYLMDEENPELTDEQAHHLRPAAEVFRELGIPMPRRRGPQKGPTKVLVSVRLDQDIVEQLRAGGPGWQTRLNRIARAAMRRSTARTSRVAAPRRGRKAV